MDTHVPDGAFGFCAGRLPVHRSARSSNAVSTPEPGCGSEVITCTVGVVTYQPFAPSAVPGVGVSVTDGAARSTRIGPLHDWPSVLPATSIALKQTVCTPAGMANGTVYGVTAGPSMPKNTPNGLPSPGGSPGFNVSPDPPGGDRKSTRLN